MKIKQPLFFESFTLLRLFLLLHLLKVLVRIHLLHFDGSIGIDVFIVQVCLRCCLIRELILATWFIWLIWCEWKWLWLIIYEWTLITSIWDVMNTNPGSCWYRQRPRARNRDFFGSFDASMTPLIGRTPSDNDKHIYVWIICNLH